MWRTAAQGPLAPWLPVLGPVDVHVAEALGDRVGETSAEVRLAIALAVRAPRHGHVCVDLARLSLADLLPEDAVATPLALPEDRDAWRDRVARSPLVRASEAGDTPFVLLETRLYADRYFHYETLLRDRFAARFAAQGAIADEALLAVGLSALFGPGPDPQRAAAEAAIRRGTVVVTGGPGTGKTWTVRNVLTLLFAQALAAGAPPPRVALAAPTGKAAARMVTSIRAGLDAHLHKARGALPPDAPRTALGAFLTGPAPHTIHRLLGWNPENPTRFRHDAERPLPFDVVIVDETSMADLALMAKLVDAVPPEARLVLLGDRHQLASVEAGTVLADLCAGGPPESVAVLTRSRRYRSDSGIARLADATLAGNELMAVATAGPWLATGPEPIGARRDVGRIPPTPDGTLPAMARALVLDALGPMYARLRAGPAADEALADHHRALLDAFDTFRVLCAHRRGPFGVEGLNAAIEGWLAAAGWIEVTDPAFVGRPVLILRNDPGTGRYNGDVGLVVRDASGARTVAFPGAEGVEYLAPVRLPEHESAFALTIHKSQGSEYDDVLVVLPERPSPVLTRELIYTGATRARRRLSLLCHAEVLAAAVRRPVQRASGLAERLRGV